MLPRFDVPGLRVVPQHPTAMPHKSDCERYTFLVLDGWLLLEHGSGQAAEVARELVARGLTHVRSHRDLAGHERMTEAQRA